MSKLSCGYTRLLRKGHLTGLYDFQDRQDGISKYFFTPFISESKVLDIGCGSRRDLRILQKLHFHITGFDPYEGFIEKIRQDKQDLQDKVTVDTLPELKTVKDNEFDGVLCSAVLMHLPKEQLFDASFAIRRVLKENGRLLLSIPLEDTTINKDSNRDSNGRLFNGIAPDELQLIFERIGFRLISKWQNEDGLNRAHRTWATMLFQFKPLINANIRE
ncbi:MAG: class I SAM-dependent methyltransferase [Verrucomicrobiota bacterium]|nr:class I SAM-dependent methyltransferase [Verrucomicrobiota bacterium]